MREKERGERKGEIVKDKCEKATHKLCTYIIMRSRSNIYLFAYKYYVFACKYMIVRKFIRV